MIGRLKNQGGVLNAAQIVLLSFVTFVTLGSLLLSLPIAHENPSHRWVDDLFMATSAVCVTGLITVDPGSTYTPFGEVVLMLLFQIGGLGYMTLLTLSLVMVGQRVSLRDRINLQQATDLPGMGGLISFILHIIRFTFIIEGIGFLLLSMAMVPAHGWGQGLYQALFHSLAAFNNAGFSLFPEGVMRWQGDPFVLIVLVGLVVIGGLGYPVNRELFLRATQHRRRPQWETLVFVVLVTTAVLLVIPTLLLWVIESRNPQTLGGMPLHLQLVNALFMAVQPRSSGFNSVPTQDLTDPSLLMLMGLMFIGGAPGSTAGGIKITTAVVLVAAVAAAVRGRRDSNLLGMKRRVSESVVRKALAVLVLSLVLLVSVTFLLLTLEPMPFLPILFEAVSAVGTVGLSMGITPQLTDASKLLLSLTMIIGRVGVIMLMLSLFKSRSYSAIRYPEEPMLVG